MKVEMFIEDYDVRLKGTTMLVYQGKSLRNFTFSVSELFHIVPTYEINDSEASNDYNRYIFNLCIEYLLKIRNAASNNIKSSLDIKGLDGGTGTDSFLKIIPENLMLVHFSNDPKGSSVWLDSNTLTEMPFLRDNRSILASISNTLGDNFETWELKREKHVVKTYRPDITAKLFQEDLEVTPEVTVPVAYYNTYNAPAWRLKYDQSEVEPGYPELFTRLMESLLPVASERKVVRKFFYLSLFYRSPMHLILHGREGSGKTTIAKVWMALAGTGNYLSQSKNAIDARFDSALLNKTCVFWDEEGPKDMKSKEKLKLYANDFFAVEQKFKDTHEATKIYASHLLANNFIEMNKLRLTDRVFLVPEVTSKKLEHNNLSESEIAWLHDFQNLPDKFLARIGYSLWEEFKEDTTSIKALLSKTYLEIIHFHLPYVEKAIVKLCKAKETFSNREVRQLAKEYAGKDGIPNYRPYIRYKEVSEFVNDYENVLKIPLCKVETTGTKILTFYPRSNSGD